MVVWSDHPILYVIKMAHMFIELLTYNCVNLLNMYINLHGVQFDALKGTLRHFSLIPPGGGGILVHSLASVASLLKVQDVYYLYLAIMVLQCLYGEW